MFGDAGCEVEYGLLKSSGQVFIHILCWRYFKEGVKVNILKPIFTLWWLV